MINVFIFMEFSTKNLPNQFTEKVAAIDQKVRVTVRVLYLPEISNEAQKIYTFGYFIDIQNLLPHKIQLLHRKWNIKNDKNQIKKIEGIGVVGQQPVLITDQIFSYNSWVQISTLAGVMDGEYLMRNLNLDENFVVKIPLFYLLHPKIVH